MGSIVSTKPEPKKNVAENAEKHKMHAPENIPSVFVNSRLLNFDSSTAKKIVNKECAKVYEINGKMFTESVQDVTEDFNKFKLYAERIDTRDMEILDSTPKTLDMDVQVFEAGYLVNSTVCLSVINYNTLIMVLGDYYNCFVCDLMVFNDDTYIDKHVTDEDHEINMALFLPLEEFGISVVRMKNEHYYCSVCNMSFHKNISEQHFNGKPHEDNLFLAANKVTDIKNNDTNIKNMNNDTNIRNKNNDRILKISDDRVIITEGKNKNEETINKNDYIMDCTVSVKIGKTVLDIPYYTWNMISISKSTKNNTFYCMACKMIDSIVNMAKHIADNLHDNNCKMFKINYAYENHLIRQDNTFSHCGTCNTIHISDGIDIHISMVHNKTKDTKELQTSVPKSELEPNDSTSIIKIENANSNNENRNNDIINRIMNERCIIFLFGMKISVLLLSLNAIFRHEFGFYCALCKVNFPFQYIHAHLDYIKNPTHMMVLNSIPALQQFGYNYIRSINNLPHCGICHAVIQPNMLLKHLQDQSHVMLTNIALGIVAPQQPVALARITPNLKNEAPNVKYPINNDLQNNDKTRDDNKNVNEMSDVINDIDGSAVINENTNNDNECNNDKLADLLEVEVALKKVNSQITLSAFNTLVPRGDGYRYCFVCAKPVQYEALKKHINDEKHIKLIKDIKFVEEYGNNLIRQKSVLYHCSLCNVILRRSELKNHITWPIHEDQKKNMTNMKKSQLKKLTKNIYATQKELIYGERDPELKVILSINLTDYKERVIDKTKVILLNGYNVKLKLKWDMWHSIASIKNAYKCIVCQVPLNEKSNEIFEHIDTEEHNVQLTMPFMKEYFPTLLREVSENVYNCVVCNTELYDKQNILTHVSGKRHKSKYKDLLNDSPDDSSEDVLLI